MRRCRGEELKAAAAAVTFLAPASAANAAQRVREGEMKASVCVCVCKRELASRFQPPPAAMFYSFSCCRRGCHSLSEPASKTHTHTPVQWGECMEGHFRELTGLRPVKSDTFVDFCFSFANTVAPPTPCLLLSPAPPLPAPPADPPSRPVSAHRSFGSAPATPRTRTP